MDSHQKEEMEQKQDRVPHRTFCLSDLPAISHKCLQWFSWLSFDSAVFQLPEGRMLSYFGVVPEGSFLDIPNAAIGTHFEPFSFDWSAFWCDIFRPTISKPSFVDWFAHFSTARFCLLLLLVVFEQILSKPGHYFGFLISNDQFGISSNQASHTGWIVHFVLVNPRHQCPAFLEYGCQFGLGWRCKEEERKGHQARMIIEVLALRKNIAVLKSLDFLLIAFFCMIGSWRS